MPKASASGAKENKKKIVDRSRPEDDDIQHLTERGTRLDETAEGYGLGLAIVGDIVKLYDGSISFKRSDELGGLSVHVLLPGLLSATRS